MSLFPLGKPKWYSCTTPLFLLLLSLLLLTGCASSSDPARVDNPTRAHIIPTTISTTPTVSKVPVTEFPLSARDDEGAITTGPDKALWFTINGAIGRMTVQGQITYFSLPFPNGIPEQITSGPDGALWFTDSAPPGSKIGRITTSGQITGFSLPDPNSDPLGIISGPDGALWFTDFGANKIGRITLRGQITEFPLPGNDIRPRGIVTGSDGALWFTNSTSDGHENEIGRITLQGNATEFPFPPAISGIDDIEVITSGPGGTLWFTDYKRNIIGRVTMQGKVTEFSLPYPQDDSHPSVSFSNNASGITAGTDGALWFTMFDLTTDHIGRITTSGQITEFTPSTHINYAGTIISGPDGALWFMEENGIARMALPSSLH